MTDKQRCIKCKSTGETSDFEQFYCENCWENTDNDELSRYESVLSWELFYLLYPDPWPSWYPIKAGADKKKLFDYASEAINGDISRKESVKSHLEKNNNTSGDIYKKLLADLTQLREQKAQIVQLESRYK